MQQLNNVQCSNNSLMPIRGEYVEFGICYNLIEIKHANTNTTSASPSRIRIYIKLLVIIVFDFTWGRVNSKSKIK